MTTAALALSPQQVPALRLASSLAPQPLPSGPAAAMVQNATRFATATLTALRQLTQALAANTAAAAVLAAALLRRAAPTPTTPAEAAGTPPADSESEGAASVAATGAARAAAFTVVLQGLVDSVRAASTALMNLAASALPGGAEVMGQVFEYLASVVGQMVAPALIVMLAGVLTLADKLRNYLAGAVGKSTDVFTSLVAITVKLIDSFLDLVDTMRVAGKRSATYLEQAAVGWGLMVLDLKRRIGLMSDEEFKARRDSYIKDVEGNKQERDRDVEEIRRRQALRHAGLDANGKPEKSTADVMLGNLDSVIKAMEQGFAQKANVGFGGISDVAKTIQMQAFQSDIQTRQLGIQRQTLDAIKELIQAVKGQRPVPAVGR